MTSHRTASPSRPVGATAIGAELDASRRQGPLKSIVVPPCPELLVRLQRELAAPEPNLLAIASLAASDVAMGATLIRVANSPACSTGAPVRTLGQALDRLGLSLTARTMTDFAARQALKVDHPALKGFWERAGRQAQALAALAVDVPGLSADLAYTYGLLCHVGMPVLLQSVRGYGATLVEAAARIDRTPVETENANHKTDHAVVGALVARVWNLGPELMSAIRLHHDLSALDDAGVELPVRLLLAAGVVADHLMQPDPESPPSAEWVRHGGAALRRLGADDAKLGLWRQRIGATLVPA
jgi:HD-like signal output (HDOD) protein